MHVADVEAQLPSACCVYPCRQSHSTSCARSTGTVPGGPPLNGDGEGAGTLDWLGAVVGGAAGGEPSGVCELAGIQSTSWPSAVRVVATTRESGFRRIPPGAHGSALAAPSASLFSGVSARPGALWAQPKMVKKRQIEAAERRIAVTLAVCINRSLKPRRQVRCFEGRCGGSARWSFAAQAVVRRARAVT